MVVPFSLASPSPIRIWSGVVGGGFLLVCNPKLMASQWSLGPKCCAVLHVMETRPNQWNDSNSRTVTDINGFLKSVTCNVCSELLLAKGLVRGVLVGKNGWEFALWFNHFPLGVAPHKFKLNSNQWEKHECVKAQSIHTFTSNGLTAFDFRCKWIDLIRPTSRLGLQVTNLIAHWAPSLSSPPHNSTAPS